MLVHERVTQRRLGERGKVDALAPRAHGLEQLVGRRGDEHDRAASRRLFDGLEELVGRLLVEAVGFEHRDDLVLGLDRGPVRLADDCLGLGNQDLIPLGLELDHVGMHAAQHEVLHALVVVGWVIKGLFWLAVIGLIVLLGTAAVGSSRRR